MRIIARQTLKLFWDQHADAELGLRAWYEAVRKAEWSGPADVRAEFRSADFVRDNRVVFNIGGNKDRLVVRIAYPYRTVFIRFVGTHADYDRIDVRVV